MDDEQLDRVLAKASTEWRVDAAPPLDAIWDAVEAEAFPSRAARPSPGWSLVAAAAAVALVIGAAGGALVTRRSIIIPPGTNPTTGLPAVQASVSSSDPNQREMGELLGRTAVLLAALPGDSTAPALDPQLRSEGARLLTTTRILMDSPVGSDARLRNLLLDLELVLAQVARLEPQHRRTEMQFIQTALDQHDIVPRLRSAAADISLNGF